MCMCVYMCAGSHRRQRGFVSPGTEVTGGCEFPVWVLGTEFQSFVQEQQVLLTSEPSLQPLLEWLLVFVAPQPY